jgi:hypothetical protein
MQLTTNHSNQSNKSENPTKIVLKRAKKTAQTEANQPKYCREKEEPVEIMVNRPQNNANLPEPARKHPNPG